jgi:catechol 2,3-dioxygenase-like lactoylglutathione lyase family enzyme
MQTTKAIFKAAFPYQDDVFNLPVADLETAIPYYEKILACQVLSRTDHPFKSVVLTRDNIQFGLAENGGDPTQDGCFFEVDNVETAFAELKANGLDREEAGYDIQKYQRTFKVFFIIAPDGLCYCLGEPMLIL